ncbi:MAG: hypothetical protein IJB89_10510 [Akkermansia sp.]|nr:hypothetical protein [Akkermansiaceae bacterium]MBQ3144932.1 hypothetical protein [Akkermansia sp.]
MNKTLFSVGALIAGCFTLTSCSGGGDSDNEQNVGVLSGRTLCLQAPNSSVGAMFIRVGDRISGNVCRAKFYFGDRGGSSSDGTVVIDKSVKGDRGWESCDFTFHLNESEISEEVEFKGFFGAYLEFSPVSGGNDDSDDDDNGENNSSSSSSGIDADSYIISVMETEVKMTFTGSDIGEYTLEPTTVYLNDSDEPVQTYVIKGRFYFES